MAITQLWTQLNTANVATAMAGIGRFIKTFFTNVAVEALPDAVVRICIPTGHPTLGMLLRFFSAQQHQPPHIYITVYKHGKAFSISLIVFFWFVLFRLTFVGCVLDLGNLMVQTGEYIDPLVLRTSVAELILLYNYFVIHLVQVHQPSWVADIRSIR